ncbi:hypothetical protein [Paractinoplanes brasiliensis]|uniref:CHAT domain-containing protein n=1 Tax=Paractinoplanes brasiliensis TaxID=52695 RepID=A0A4R6JLD8_9ACTN|nr:hypothetical protein [Actinoplanes brasiliensis]TDO37124.1 hypothetical protein C8E87_0722 [Actinoplanes brasiliensis]GID32180.1 hypothetical protein Abr02nite_71630 [Actinoplanes brasiliensis]
MTSLPADWVNARPGIKYWSADARGDDPAQRVVHAPTGAGPGDGRTFLFLFGYRTASAGDREMLAAELAHIDDDVAVLTRAGYTVVVDRQATRRDLLEAVAAEGTAGVYWSSHGGQDGHLQCCDGDEVRPADLDPATASSALRLVVLGACYVGAHAAAWRAALGGRPLVTGWGRPVTLDRAVDFLDAEDGLDHLIDRWLLTDAPIPPAPNPGSAPPRVRGRTKGLHDRVRTLAHILGAEYGKGDGQYEVTVPLPGGRTHVVRVFAVDGADPYAEGVELCGLEARVGPMSALLTPERLLAGSAAYGRVALVAGDNGTTEIVTQSFTPLDGASARHLAAHCYQVARQADALELDVFGID